MIYCPLCEKNIIIITTLCQDCKKIRQLANLYGIEKIYDILRQVLIREEDNINETLDELKEDSI